MHGYRLGADGSSPWFGNPPKQELRENIEASLEDMVLEKPLLRGVTPEPLSDGEQQGFPMNQSGFSSAAPLKGPSRAQWGTAEGRRPMVVMRLAQLIAARWRC